MPVSEFIFKIQLNSVSRHLICIGTYILHMIKHKLAKN